MKRTLRFITGHIKKVMIAIRGGNQKLNGKENGEINFQLTGKRQLSLTMRLEKNISLTFTIQRCSYSGTIGSGIRADISAGIM